MAKAEPDSIIAELRGQSIVLPNLNAMFESWPKQVNTNLDRLRHDVDGWLDRYRAPHFSSSCEHTPNDPNIHLGQYYEPQFKTPSPQSSRLCILWRDMVPSGQI